MRLTGSLSPHHGRTAHRVGASSVDDLPFSLATSNQLRITFIDFDEHSVTSSGTLNKASGSVPIGQIELMKYIEEFDNDELASMAEEDAKGEAD